jgi:hypothetical protein
MTKTGKATHVNVEFATAAAAKRAAERNKMSQWFDPKETLISEYNKVE